MWRLSSVLVFCVVLTGCVLSNDAVVPESAATFDARLLGGWEEVGGSDRAVVSSARTNAYAIEYTDSDGQVGRFEARLGRLGTRLVLDVLPAPRQAGSSPPEAGALIRGHVLFDLQVGADTARVALLEQGALVAVLAGGASHLAHVTSGDQLILTDATDRLRVGLARYLDRAGPFGSPSVWHRTGGPEPAAPGPDKSARHTAAAALPGAPTAPRATPNASRTAPPASPTASSTASPTAAAQQGQDPCFESAPWREADLLFRRDPHWVGSDGAYSIDLGHERILWLFGDTRIDPSGRHTRCGARMVRNTVAIQKGADPSRAEMTFYWGETRGGEPGPLFADQGDDWFWPGNGIRLENCLVLFLMRTRGSSGGLGFESAGWNAVLVSNPDAEPSQWKVKWLDTPRNALGVVVGSAGVVRWGDQVYAFGSQEPVKSHPMYVVRWPVAALRRGDLRAPEWWAGADAGWVPDSSQVARWPAFENGQSELTVHFDEPTRRFVVVQSVGFGAADVAVRFAPELTGPWTQPRTVHRPAEFYRPKIMIYAAKAHPELSGADLVLTYATNTFEFAEQMTDSTSYYPRFVRLTRCP
jgi:hypothetical protein